MPSTFLVADGLVRGRSSGRVMWPVVMLYGVYYVGVSGGRLYGFRHPPRIVGEVNGAESSGRRQTPRRRSAWSISRHLE